jgi:hypothetical protein
MTTIGSKPAGAPAGASTDHPPRWTERPAPSAGCGFLILLALLGAFGAWALSDRIARVVARPIDAYLAMGEIERGALYVSVSIIVAALVQRRKS